MITIHSAMLVLLGVLGAGLFVVIVTPFYRNRVQRLAVDTLKRSLPLTQSEINADKDRLRAEYAIRIHKLALKVKEAESAGARQSIELNRRDARIGALESDAAALRDRLEESDNARRVLEQTIQDRLPKLEYRLVEAKKLIFNRDRDISALTTDSERTVRALDEAMQINAQQRAEIARLRALTTSRGSGSYGALSDPKYDVEVALRSELEVLRSQARDQSALIARLQATVSGVPNDADTSNIALLEAERLKREAREQALIVPNGPIEAALKSELDALKVRSEEQAGEIRQLKAALAAYEQPDQDGRTLSVRDTKIALKARVGSLQSQVDTQGESIKRLRAELAAANERLARQAAHFMDEMRRLGAGSLPTTPPARRAEGVGRGIRERIARVNPAFAERMAPSGVESGLAPVRPDATPSVAQHIKTLAGEGTADAAAPDDAAGARADDRRRGRLIDRIADSGKS